MATIRPPKKNDVIEVRLSDETKAAFRERCRQDQRTASEAIRLFIDGQITRRPDGDRRRVPHWRIALAGVVGAVFGIGVAAPSLAWGAQNSRAAFDLLDRDRDGVLSYQEFRIR